jgi:hypothetical protein
MTLQLLGLTTVSLALFLLLRWIYVRRDYGTDPRIPGQHPWIDKYGRLLRQVLRSMSRSIR